MPHCQGGFRAAVAVSVVVACVDDTAAVSLPCYCSVAASRRFPRLAVDKSVRFGNLSEAILEVARFVRSTEPRSNESMPGTGMAGPQQAVWYYREFLEPLLEDHDLWDFSALRAVGVSAHSTDVGAYALLAALFHIAVLADMGGQAPAEGGSECLAIVGDVQLPAGARLCAAWRRGRQPPGGDGGRGPVPVLDDAWLEHRRGAAEDPGGRAVRIEVLKRRDAGRDTLLYTTAHSPGDPRERAGGVRRRSTVAPGPGRVRQPRRTPPQRRAGHRPAAAAPRAAARGTQLEARLVQPGGPSKGGARGGEL